MLILVRHAPPFRRWHRRLGERLEAAGHRVGFEAADRPAGRRLMVVERRLYGVATSWNVPEPAPPTLAGKPELTIVLAGEPAGEALMLRPRIGDGFGEAALLEAARAGHAPCVTILGGAPGAMRPLVRGRPAMEDPLVLARALEDLLPRLVTLLVQAVAHLDDGDPPVDLDDGALARRVAPLAFFVRGLYCKLARRFGPERGRPAHWRLAMRRDGEADFGLLLDDGPARFRADPFLFEEAGRLWLFYEEYPYASGKGVIGRLAIAAADLLPKDDPSLDLRRTPEGAGEARVVLEEDFHLSYPLVLRYGDAIFMLPEMTEASRVQLYRADPFPDRWRPDAVLLEGCRLADATPIRHEGRWWLFATANDDGGSSWDQLHLFHAPDLFGPWIPHAGNPVLIDAGAGRPAGPMWHENGVLMRPAQDCRRGYGDGVAICRVDRLDAGGFRQTVVRRIEPPPGANGIHTVARAVGWEAVDLRVPHPRR